MARKRASIEPERLGSTLRGRDVLIPEHHNGTTSQGHDVTESKPEIRPAESRREATTIRFSTDTVKALVQVRSRLLLELDLRASQSDIVEAALLRSLSDLEQLAGSIRALQDGSLRPFF